MRNLNFRVWDKHFKIMGDLVSIDFQEKWIIAKVFNLVPDDGEWGMSFRNTEIMQSTGYTDENGIEIYEGDILKIVMDNFGSQDYILPIYWDELTCSLMIDIPYEDWGSVCVGYLDDADIYEKFVIGNICENPELLEKKE